MRALRFVWSQKQFARGPFLRHATWTQYMQIENSRDILPFRSCLLIMKRPSYQVLRKTRLHPSPLPMRGFGIAEILFRAKVAGGGKCGSVISQISPGSGKTSVLWTAKVAQSDNSVLFQNFMQVDPVTFSQFLSAHSLCLQM